MSPSLYGTPSDKEMTTMADQPPPPDPQNAPVNPAPEAAASAGPKSPKLEMEKLPKIEQKEIKSEGKIEHKESLIKEHKPEKLEIPEKLVIETIPVGDPPLGDPALHARLTQIEASIAELRHFIKPADRPDLSQGALSNEPDVQPGS
ncbi:MAG: hypothetical protein NVSMB32_06470 [Actinomycetota bacterium]